MGWGVGVGVDVGIGVGVLVGVEVGVGVGVAMIPLQLDKANPISVKNPSNRGCAEKRGFCQFLGNVISPALFSILHSSSLVL